MADKDYIFNRDFLLHLFDIDVNNGKIYWKNPSKHHINLTGKEAGSPTPSRANKNYWVITINKNKIKRSHIIFFIANNYRAKPCIDHIDGNSLNDGINNLRQASIQQNAWNHKKRTKKTDLPMGIKKSKNNKFIARITINNNQIHLGTFNLLEDANNAYIKAREKFYGQFA